MIRVTCCGVLGFGLWDSEIKDWVSVFGFRMWGLGFRVSGFRVWGLVPKV